MRPSMRFFPSEQQSRRKSGLILKRTQGRVLIFANLAFLEYLTRIKEFPLE